MRTLAAIAVFIGLPSSVQAAVVAFLQTDPVTIIVQGSDSDAGRLYNYLDVEPTEKPGSILEKQLESPSGQVNMTCRLSELTQGVSCTIKVKRASNLEVSEEKKRVYLVNHKNDDVEYFFTHFVKNSDGEVPMYVSERQDFAFSSSDEHFILSYQQVGQ